jgi:hypothetical protein
VRSANVPVCMLHMLDSSSLHGLEADRLNTRSACAGRLFFSVAVNTGELTRTADRNQRIVKRRSNENQTR